MNVLEKAKLIQELNLLIDGLDQRSLSFFEIARSKARIKDIFALCDDPIFKKQILQFKSHTQPEKAATDFAAQTLFQRSFRGVFQQDTALEQALYHYPYYGWAILYHPQLGWQIWLIPAAKRTALISEWGNLEDAYQWMLQQQQNYNCLKTDHELKQIQALIVPQITHGLTETGINRSSASADAPQSPLPHKQSNSMDLSPAGVNPHQARITTDASVQPPRQSAGSNLEQTDVQSSVLKAVPEILQLNQYVAHIRALPDQEAALQQLYRLEIPSLPELAPYLDILLHAANLENWQHHPVYLAEQTNQQGGFVRYLALLGVENPAQATQLMQLFNAPYQYAMAAIKQMSWMDWADHFSAVESLFDAYTYKARCIWNDANYMPFIPAQLIQTQKIIQFDESAADIHTPLLLLKERLKIRLIHGQNRLALSPTEWAYPYFLLERHHGISWQMIQRIITQFSSPIDCRELYKEIQKHISD